MFFYRRQLIFSALSHCCFEPCPFAVAESKIYYALSPLDKDPANIALAKLVMERQKQRMETKKQYGKQDSEEVDEELRW